MCCGGAEPPAESSTLDVVLSTVSGMTGVAGVKRAIEDYRSLDQCEEGSLRGSVSTPSDNLGVAKRMRNRERGGENGRWRNGQGEERCGPGMGKSVMLC